MIMGGKMVMNSRMEVFRTSLQASRTNWMKWTKGPAAEGVGVSDDKLFDVKNRLLHFDAGRFVVFDGGWKLPQVTVRPAIEFWWNYRSQALDEPNATSIFSDRNLYVAAGIGLSALAYYAVMGYKRRTLVANPPLAPYRAPDSGPIGLSAVPSLAGYPSTPVLANLTTKQKIKQFLRTRNVRLLQRVSLNDFLTCLDLECYVESLEGKVVEIEDLVILSFEEMTELGIRRVDHIVQIKNGLNFLMDLHNRSFRFAPVPKAV